MLARFTVRSCENVRAKHLGKAPLPRQKDASSVTLKHLVALFRYSPTVWRQNLTRFCMVSLSQSRNA
ncbi:MAG: hypothetical protein DDT19_02372 [Syntrophomonadaceae bacterium]|nr:hypothetical protein [Bacillota bacterium]